MQSLRRRPDASELTAGRPRVRPPRSLRAATSWYAAAQHTQTLIRTGGFHVNYFRRDSQKETERIYRKAEFRFTEIRLEEGAL